MYTSLCLLRLRLCVGEILPYASVQPQAALMCHIGTLPVDDVDDSWANLKIKQAFWAAGDDVVLFTKCTLSYVQFGRFFPSNNSCSV